MRCLIVGNGPSLRETPLDKIKYDVSFGMNRIHLLYDKVDWRPDVYVLADRGQRWEEFVEDIRINMEDNEQDTYLRVDIGRAKLAGQKGGIPGLKKALYEYPQYKPFAECWHNYNEDSHPDGFHLPHLCKYGGSLYVAAQVAMKHYKFDEIVFVGIDGKYKSHSLDNHFDNTYRTIDAYSDKDIRGVNAVLDRSHSIIRDEAKKRGIEVYNATPDSQFSHYQMADVGDFC